MPFGFGSNKREKEPLFNTHLIDADDLDEINKITEILNPDSLKAISQAKKSIWSLYRRQFSGPAPCILQPMTC
ncbi:MAG: hypothetical protein M3250_01845 [Thermoproteota archaeon]|nr:hypothetical protein [Thermoproteota archaeon]